MTFVDWVKWLVGFLCAPTHTCSSHTHTHTNNSNAPCEIPAACVHFFYFFFSFLWVASFSIFMHATHFVLLYLCLLIAAVFSSPFAAATAEVVWMWHVWLLLFLIFKRLPCLAACLYLCLPQSIPLRDNLSIQLFAATYISYMYKSLITGESSLPGYAWGLWACPGFWLIES